MVKVGIVGSPSTGKTTLAEGISYSFKSLGKYNRIDLITEYAREFVSNFGIPTTADQKHILDMQIRNEEISKDADLMITDSPFWLCYIYACHTFNNNKKDSYYLNKIHEYIINNIYNYDVVFYIPFSIEFYKNVNIKDGQRIHEDISEIAEIDGKIKSFMNLHGICYHSVQSREADERKYYCNNIIEKKIREKNQKQNG
jgi:nicotinamide riboside kinase